MPVGIMKEYGGLHLAVKVLRSRNVKGVDKIGCVRVTITGSRDH